MSPTFFSGNRHRLLRRSSFLPGLSTARVGERHQRIRRHDQEPGRCDRRVQALHGRLAILLGLVDLRGGLVSYRSPGVCETPDGNPCRTPRWLGGSFLQYDIASLHPSRVVFLMVFPWRNSHKCRDVGPLLSLLVELQTGSCITMTP